MGKRKYLQDEEQAIEAAKTTYLQALIELQEVCEHKTILEHVDSHYHMFRVCEDCGTTCRADWSSSVWAFGNMAIFGGRAYKVGWTEFAQATPKVGGWCQKRDEPERFSRGGKTE